MRKERRESQKSVGSEDRVCEKGVRVLFACRHKRVVSANHFRSERSIARCRTGFAIQAYEQGCANTRFCHDASTAAKSCRVMIEVSSRRRRSCRALAFASSWLISGDSAREFLVGIEEPPPFSRVKEIQRSVVVAVTRRTWNRRWRQRFEVYLPYDRGRC